MPLLPSIIKREDKVFMAVSANIVKFFIREGNLKKDEFVIQGHLFYLSIDKLSDPHLKEFLLVNAFVPEVKVCQIENICD